MEVVNCKTVEDAVDALRQPTTTWIVANGRKLNDKDARRIARALRSNTHLKELSLAGNHIGPDGASAIASAVVHHPRLRELYLHKNRLGLEGVERMAKIFQKGGSNAAPALQLLNISKNKINGHLPFHIVVPSLKTLHVTNNEISEIPARFAQCNNLTEVFLDGNPLVSPPIELYMRTDWTRVKEFLEANQDLQRKENHRNGYGRVTNEERNLALLTPAHRSLYEGNLGEAMSYAHRAKEIFMSIGVSARHCTAQSDQLAAKISLLARIEGSSVGKDNDVEFVVHGRSFMVERSVVAKCPLLEAELLDGTETMFGQSNHGLHETIVDITTPPSNRLRTTVQNTTVLAFKCFLNYLSTGDLELSLMMCLRECSDEAKRLATSSFDAYSTDAHSNDSSDTDDEGPSRMSMDRSAGCPDDPTGVDLRVIESMDASMDGSTVKDKLGYIQWTKPSKAVTTINLDGVPASVHIMLGAIVLAKRYNFLSLKETGLELLWDLLQPANAVLTLKTAHHMGENSVTEVCLDFLQECCNHISKADWRLLATEGELLVEVMNRLQERERKVNPAEEIKNMMLMQLMSRCAILEKQLAIQMHSSNVGLKMHDGDMEG